MNKRGISGIVETALLIMISVGAITLIAVFIIPFIRNSLEKSTECTGMEQAFKFDNSFNLNCNNLSEGKWQLAISVKGNENYDKVQGFNLILSESGNSEVIEVRDGKDNPLIYNYAGGSQEMVPIGGGIKSYIYNATNKQYGKMEMNTVLKNGRVCEILADKMDVGVC